MFKFRPFCFFGHAVRIHVPLSPSSIIWYQSQGGAITTCQWFLTTGKVTIHLALSKGDKHPVSTPTLICHTFHLPADETFCAVDSSQQSSERRRTSRNTPNVLPPITHSTPSIATTEVPSTSVSCCYLCHRMTCPLYWVSSVIVAVVIIVIMTHCNLLTGVIWLSKHCSIPGTVAVTATYAKPPLWLMTATSQCTSCQ